MVSPDDKQIIHGLTAQWVSVINHDHAGEALAITYQSAEGDGALALYAAVRWFNGESLAPVIYLPKHIITKSDVNQYLPAQW